MFLLNKLSLEVIISKIFKTNVNALRIATLNELRTRHKNARIVKITNDTYRSTLYRLRMCFTFLTLTKIILNNDLKLIKKKLRSNK